MWTPPHILRSSNPSSAGETSSYSTWNYSKPALNCSKSTDGTWIFKFQIIYQLMVYLLDLNITPRGGGWSVNSPEMWPGVSCVPAVGVKGKQLPSPCSQQNQLNTPSPPRTEYKLQRALPPLDLELLDKLLLHLLLCLFYCCCVAAAVTASFP